MKLLGFVSNAIKLLSVIIQSYFGPTLYTNEGGGGGVSSGLLPYYLINTWLYKRQILKVLEIPFKVSKHTRLVKNLLYGYHGNCLITWCFSLKIVKTIMKNR